MAPASGRCSAASTRSAARTATTTTRGAGRWRGTRPFKRWKREVHEGGVADPCIVRLPALGTRAPGGVRRQFAHAIDILPTVLELVGLGIRRQRSTGSTSRTSTAPASPTSSASEAPRARPAPHPALRDAQLARDLPRRLEGGDVPPGGPDLRRRPAVQRAVGRRRLGALPRRRGRLGVTDLAAEFPEKVAELVALWWEEAGATTCFRSTTVCSRSWAHKHDGRRYQDAIRYFQDGAPVPEWVAVDVRNRSHAITVDRRVARRRRALGHAARARAARSAGGRCTSSTAGCATCTTCTGKQLYEVVADTALGAGRHEVEFRFDKDELLGGTAALLVDGRRSGGRGRALHPGRLQRGR